MEAQDLTRFSSSRRPSIFAAAEHMFFWSSDKVQKFVNRVFSLISRDPGLDDLLVEASPDVIPVGNAGDLNWRTHLDPALLVAIDDKLAKEEASVDESLVGLIFAFKAALDSMESWPKQLKLHYSGKDELTGYLLGVFPKFLVAVSSRAALRKQQLLELIPLYDLEAAD